MTKKKWKKLQRKKLQWKRFQEFLKLERKEKKEREERKKRLGVEKGENLHHIIPKSRCTCKDDGNLVVIGKVDHAKLHGLFGNLLPDEIITILVDFYWNGQWEHVENALEAHRYDKATKSVP